MSSQKIRLDHAICKERQCKSETSLVSYLRLCWNVVLGIKCNSLFPIHKSMACFNVWLQTVIQITCFVPLVCCIHDVVVRMIKIVLLASPQLVSAPDKFPNVLNLQTNGVSNEKPNVLDLTNKLLMYLPRRYNPLS